MAAGASSDARPLLLLVDAGSLGTSLPRAVEPWGAPHGPPAHRLDTAEKVLECCRQLFARRPGSRVHVLLRAPGYSCLSAAWQGGGSVACALDPSCVHCVPFGCEVRDFLLEIARCRAAGGQRVAVVSNAEEVVLAAKAVVPPVQHLGFMFVEGDFILPGLPPVPAAATRPPPVPASAEAAAAASPAAAAGRAERGKPRPARRASPRPARRCPPLQRAISKGTPPRGRPAAGAAVFLDSLADCSDDDGGAPRDSQLDGVALDDGDAAGRMADEGGGASAGGLADLPLRPAAAGGLRGALRAPGGTTGAPDDVHLADTLVDLDAVGLDAEGPGQPAARDAGPSPARSSPGSPPPSQSRAEAAAAAAATSAPAQEPSMAAAPATTSQATETAGLSETAPAAAAAAFLCQGASAGGLPPRPDVEADSAQTE